MKRIDNRLIETANIIDSKFEKVDKENRDELSTEILTHLRNFCEAFMYKVYDEDTNNDLFQTQENLKEKVRKHFKINYYDFYKFHTLLDSSVGHISFGNAQSEALTIKYIPYLIKMKTELKEKYGIEVLKNIYKYPLDLDESIVKFYEKILYVLRMPYDPSIKYTRNQYFIRKRTMKYINGYIFYEYVLDVSDDKVNKFNTFVCYSFKNIRFNYDLKLQLSKKEITFLNTKITINVIHDYEYSIRLCAFKNILYLINHNVADGKRDNEYKYLMGVIKNNNISLVDIVDEKYDFEIAGNGYYTKFISYIKEFINDNPLGTNTIRFLLLDMRNNVIKAQTYKPYKNMPLYNDEFNGLRIRLATKAFELMPFAFNPKEAKLSLTTLLEVFDSNDRCDEILYHRMSEYINKNNILFLKPADIGYSNEDFLNLAGSFNKKIDRLYKYYDEHKIVEFKGNYTIDFYYKLSMNVVESSIKLASIENDSFETRKCDSNSEKISAVKKNIINNIFLKNHIAIITGSAGTGKTTLIKELIKLYDDKNILCLTTTNTANYNLKLDNASNVDYMNIAQFEMEKIHNIYDIIIVDEASFVSAKSIEKVLNCYPNKFFLFAGDPEQIESIEFGNWFSLLIEFIKQYNVAYTLNDEYRTNVDELKKVWNVVREGKKNNILELLSAYEMTEKISEDIFTIHENEVVLCLNYDGLYGINNINRYLQASNPNKSHEYQQNIYKVNDPVVFIVNDYSDYGIYNNFKGKIVNIIEDNNNIQFEILLSDKALTGRLSHEIWIEKREDLYYAIVTKSKYYDRYDTDMDTRTKLPFQVSYAMSIHKAQGLEFDSVKVVITKETDELINKNIFYTAITRAKKNLKIYWEPEVANYVLDVIENNDKTKGNDLALLKEIIKE